MTSSAFIRPDSLFATYEASSYPHQFRATLHLDTLVGGVPSDPRVAEGWIRTKIQDTDDRIRQMVAETMEARGVTAEEAAEIVNTMKNLNGFKRTPEGYLYIEGRQVKAMLKESVSVAIAAKKIDIRGWGETKKWITGFFPEHVFVDETVIPLGLVGDDGEPTGKFAEEPYDILQQFVHTRHGSSIQYQEYMKPASISFTVVTDFDFKPAFWSALWTTAQRNGLGASRSQGYGTFVVTQWDKIK